MVFSRRPRRRLAGPPRTLLFVATPLCVVAFALAASAESRPGVTPVSGTPVAEMLPDLDQETPTQLQVGVSGKARRPDYRLGFRSAVRNLGAGPLIVQGARPDEHTPYMRVDQVIDRAAAPPVVIRGVGRMRYTVSPDHRHWHYLQFERYELQRYELRRAGTAQAVARDRKTGFCLGDRYRVTSPDLPAAPPEPLYTGRCGLTQPHRLRMRAGISVGYGDDYSAFLEGQDLPLNGLRDGRYVLVHRVNRNRRLRELSYANNAASVLLDLRWRAGEPYLRILRSCPDSARCDREQSASVASHAAAVPTRRAWPWLRPQ